MSLFSDIFKKDKKNTNITNEKEQWIRDTYAIWMQMNFVSFEYFCEGPYDNAVASRQRFLLSRDWGIKSAYDCDKMAEDLTTRIGDRDELSWNLCRVMQIYGMAYCAGYFTRERMIENSVEIAQIMQRNFSSWDDLIRSYLKGYENWVKYFQGDNAEELVRLRYECYNEVRFCENPAYKVNWNYNFKF